MKFPIKETELRDSCLNYYPNASENVLIMLTSMIQGANQTYKTGVKQGIECNYQEKPYDKKKYIEMMENYFAEEGKEFTDTHRDIFISLADIMEEAYGQGVLEGVATRYSKASENCNEQQREGICI